MGCVRLGSSVWDLFYISVASLVNSLEALISSDNHQKPIILVLNKWTALWHMDFLPKLDFVVHSNFWFHISSSSYKLAYQPNFDQSSPTWLIFWDISSYYRKKKILRVFTVHKIQPTILIQLYNDCWVINNWLSE